MYIYRINKKNMIKEELKWREQGQKEEEKDEKQRKKWKVLDKKMEEEK